MSFAMHIVAVVSLALFCGQIEAGVDIKAENIHMGPAEIPPGQKENEVVWHCEWKKMKAAPHSTIECNDKDTMEVYGDVNTLSRVRAVNNTLEIEYFDTEGYSLGPDASVVTNQLTIDVGGSYNHSFNLAPNTMILTIEKFIVKTKAKSLKLVVEPDASILSRGTFMLGSSNPQLVSEMHVQGAIIGLKGAEISSADITIVVRGLMSVDGGNFKSGGTTKTAQFTIEEDAIFLVHGNSLEIDAEKTVLDVNGTLCVDKDLILTKDHLSINKGLNSTFIIGGSVVDGQGNKKKLSKDLSDNIEFLAGNETCADFFLIDDVTQKPSAAPSVFIFSFQTLFALVSIAYLLN